MPATTPALSQAEPAKVEQGLRYGHFATQDWIVLGYLSVLLLAVLQGQRDVRFLRHLFEVFGLLASAALGIFLVRFTPFGEHRVISFVYRVAIYLPVQSSYFMFRDLLPRINPRALDAELYALDLKLFGVEPAVAWDRFVTPLTTEWFAFFYFSYFFVIIAHLIPLLFTSREQRLVGEFTTGVLGVVCVGHTIYMLVPGFGPYRAMPQVFSHPFPKGLWLDMVMEAVNSGGAMKDIFPSLHTALPTFITLFAFRHRARPPFRYTWPVIGFFTCNIIVATMFLRWHYLIDVIAGLALATLCGWLAPVLVDRELRKRRQLGIGPMWPMP